MITKLLLEIGSGRGDRARLSILIFHRVLPVADPLFSGDMDAGRFDALAAHLKKRFNVLPLERAIESLREGSLPSRALCLSFDDGYADNLKVAAPILRKHGVPAIVFVATAYLDGGCMWNDIVLEACRNSMRPDLDLAWLGLGIRSLATPEDRRAVANDLLETLKYQEFSRRDEWARKVAQVAGTELPRNLMLASSALRDFEQFGIAIGAHTRRHPILANSPNPIAWDEISEGRRELQELLGAPVGVFAYPNGKPGLDFTAEHVRMVREAGFSAAVTTAHGAATARSDVYQLPRFTPWRTDALGFDLLMLKNLRHAVEAQGV